MKLTIERDDDAESPSTDNEVFLLAGHRDFYVPPTDEHNFDMATELKSHEKSHHIFSLEAYIHSGVRLALLDDRANFPDRAWDVSRVGFVFVDKKLKRLRKSAAKIARGYVEDWNTYLSGDIWGYVISDEATGKVLDSVWGYYGKESAQLEGARALADANSNLNYEI